MKKPLAILLLLFLFFCSCSKTEETIAQKPVTKNEVYFSNLIEVERQLYQKYSDEPYTGDVIDTTNVPKNEVRKGYVQIGYRTGKWLTKNKFNSIVSQERLYKDGILVEQRDYENGLTRRHATFWDNGNDQKMQIFNDKSEVEIEINYDENGEYHGWYQMITGDDSYYGIYKHGEIEYMYINDEPMIIKK